MSNTTALEDLQGLLTGIPSYQVPLQRGVTWDLRRAPHAIVAGVTGAGKTYFTSYLIAALALQGSLVYVADPKNADLASLADVMPGGRVASSTEGIGTLLGETLDIMQTRYAAMRDERWRRGLLTGDFADFGYPAVVFVIDEMAAYESTLDRKAREVFDAGIKSLTLQGRAAGVELISVMQSPNAGNISTESRSQMGLKVYLGNSSGIEQRMLFGDGFTFPNRLYRPGQGLYMLAGQTNSPQLLETPRIDKGQLPGLLRGALNWLSISDTNEPFLTKAHR
jgi:DNA segregation ATPase FtsK/SpoIIIE-like protein